MKIRWKMKVLGGTLVIVARFNMSVTAKEMTAFSIIALAITLPMRCVWTIAAVPSVFN